MSRVCVTIKKYNVNKPPYIQIRLFTARENEDLEQVAYVNYTLNELSELSDNGGFFCSSNAYEISLKVKIDTKPSIFGTTSIIGNRDDSYCLLPVSFILEIISLDFPHLISSSLQKCTQEKLIAPTISNSQKIKKEFGDLFSSKNPTIYEASSGKESTMDQELEICIRVYELAI